MEGLKFGQDIGEGKKFNADGSARFFPGNTMVCTLDHDSEVYRRIRAERDHLKTLAVAPCLTFMPDDSLHMTAIEGVVDRRRTPDRWTSLLPLDTPLVKVDDFFEKAFATVPPMGEVRMTFDHLRCTSAVVVALRPATAGDEKTIRSWREKVSKATGLRFPGFETYEFHITLAYGIRMPQGKEMEALDREKERFDQECKDHPFTFVVPRPSLTFFDNMLYFHKERIAR